MRAYICYKWKDAYRVVIYRRPCPRSTYSENIIYVPTLRAIGAQQFLVSPTFWGDFILHIRSPGGPPQPLSSFPPKRFSSATIFNNNDTPVFTFEQHLYQIVIP